MPIVTIDGTTYEYEGEQKLLQFCLNQGIELPHFCYHPAMSIPANCRQCLVKVGMPKKDRETGEVELNEDGEAEIQYLPGLQASCTIDLADGMVVETHRSSEEVRDAQTDNLEFLLANHPLDCPICDQAGHCPLMNTIDICPVGALTATDFRFKARIWEMSSTPSITTTNATGANCKYWVRDNQVLRITPRQNMEVNEYWLPDEDRLVYNKFNDNRPDGPHIMKNGSRTGARWEQAYAKAASLLGSTDPERMLFLGSAHATVEDNYLLKQLAEAVGADAPRYIPHIEPGAGDDWLITDDKTPNANGCERLGIPAIDEELVGSRIANGKYDLIYVLEDDPVGAGLCSAEELDDVDVVLHYYNTTNETLPRATAALPAAMVVETVGTYVNRDGRAQRVRPAKEIQGVNRTLMMEMGTNREDEHGTPFDRWHNDENKINCTPSWEILPAIAEKVGIDMDYTKGPKAIMDEVQSTIDAFDGATYDAMGLKGVQLEEVEAGAAA